MREHYLKVGMQVSATPSFFDNPDAGRAFMYLSYWYAGLYVVCEGWQEAKRSDPEIDAQKELVMIAFRFGKIT